MRFFLTRLWSISLSSLAGKHSRKEQIPCPAKKQPNELLWADYGRGYLVTTPIQVHKIVVTIPDEPDWDKELSNIVVVYGEYERFCHAILLPVEHANKILTLLGIEKIPGT